MVSKLAQRLTMISRAQKRAILISYDVLAMAVALLASFSARLGEAYWPNNPLVFVAAAISFAIGIAGLYYLQIYRIVLRFFDLRTVSRILFGAAVTATAWVIAVYFLRPTLIADGLVIAVPRSVGFIFGGFLFVLLFMGRYTMALLVSGASQSRKRSGDDGVHVVIYGANSAGISLGESVRRDPAYRLCAFVEDDERLHGQMAAGVPIYAPTALPALVREQEIGEVFLAMPKATRSQRLAAIARLNPLNIEVKTVPSAEEIVSGRFMVSDVRPIEVNDLLRRDPVEPLTELIRSSVHGRSILVTGAGGSIGSEICRQLIQARPRKLVLLDHSEFALYTIEQQLFETLATFAEGERPQLVPVMGSILNEQLVRELIAREGVDTIYHAAAYKHVPLIEDNEIAGVENNVLGTLVIARAAAEAKLTRFTMISTDKAVRPESVMGASKRVAELIVQGLAERNPETRFGIVRFGNVLDSSGSVVQRFRSQIRRGGPVTVTHRDVTRFFMSIPEATQLVLQAGAMARHGEVFVLDMGEPIRIADLAEHMIRLSGMTVKDESNPMGDIEITYVGLRPGEKLYEELFVGEEVVPTDHPRINKAMERSLSFEVLERHLEAMRGAIAGRDRDSIRAVLQEVIAPDQGVLSPAPAPAAAKAAAPRTVH
jgi:FlaA1/EpsC-like NDP-sugar epimerase